MLCVPSSSTAASAGPASQAARVGAELLSVGTATPERFTAQDAIAEQLAETWNLKGAALARWRRIVAGTGIGTRHGVAPIDEVVHLTTAQRMALYESHAPPLAAQAARRAMDRAGVDAAAITDLIVVSCTGFAAPGLDVALVETLGLQATVRRTMIGFMGCFGAISGLRTAVGACAANREMGAVALVVCLELCSLHLRADDGVQNQVAAALFADGAAAAILASQPQRDAHARDIGCSEACAPIGMVNTGASVLLRQGRNWMTWRITDVGFAMTLTRDVPQALRESLASFVAGLGPPSPRSLIVHPGGPGILDAVHDALTMCDDCELDCSRAVLRRYGNMSSATVLFVLEEAMRRGMRWPAMMLAFGPGLTIESIQIAQP